MITLIREPKMPPCKRNFSTRTVAPSDDSRSTNKRHTSSISCTQKIRDGLQETKTFSVSDCAENNNGPKTKLNRKRNFAKTKIPKTKLSRNWQICSFSVENENETEIRSVSNVGNLSRTPDRQTDRTDSQTDIETYVEP